MFQLKRLYIFKRYFKPVLFVYFLYIHARVHEFIAILRIDSYKSIISNRIDSSCLIHRIRGNL